MNERRPTRVAIIDNSIDPRVYKPVEHWGGLLAVPWESFRAPERKLPDLGRFSHVILSGSEASILDVEPWVEDEIALTSDAFMAGLSILGSCYGHQLLARALAGPEYVGRCGEPEIGWIPVAVEHTGALLGPSRTAYSFSLHFDEVRGLPADRFEVLAGSANCPIQAFVVRERNVWGLQIHPEIDIPTARALLEGVVATRGRGWNLCLEALKTVPRDSRLIDSIMPAFIGDSP